MISASIVTFRTVLSAVLLVMPVFCHAEEPAGMCETVSQLSGTDCTPDQYEPNDDTTTATDLGTMGCFLATGLNVTPPMFMMPTDLDLFRFRPASSGPLAIGATKTGGDGGLALFLSDEASGLGEPLAGIEVYGTDFFVAEVAEGTTYFILVIGGGFCTDDSDDMPQVIPCAECVEYDLFIGRVDDPLEENDSFAQAHHLTTSGYHNEKGLAVCSDDDDWYSYTAPSHGSITVNARFSHLYGDIDLRVYNSSQVLLGEGVTNTDDETVTVDVTRGADYYIRVNHLPTLQDCACNRYDLSITPDDVYEDNDSDREMSDLGMPACLAETDLWIHGQDEDWYLITANYEGSIVIDLVFPHAEGNIDVAAYQRRGMDWSLSASSTSLTDNETLVVNAREGERFRLQVYLDYGPFPVLGRGDCTRYAMLVRGGQGGPLDTDADGDVDLADYAELQRRFTGP